MLNLLQLELFCWFSHTEELVCRFLFSGVFWGFLYWFVWGFFNTALRHASNSVSKWISVSKVKGEQDSGMWFRCHFLVSSVVVRLCCLTLLILSPE